MQAILWGRMDYLSEVTNVEEAYRAFGAGAPKQFVIDPHGALPRTA
jgi:hypothetical protein